MMYVYYDWNPEQGGCIKASDDPPDIPDGMLVVGNLAFSPLAQDILRRALQFHCPRCADLSAEQVEVALLERELEQAKTDGVIEYYGHDSPHCTNHQHVVKVQAEAIAPDGDGPITYCPNDTRLLAARAAADFVRERRKPKPEPEEMDPPDIANEIRAEGYSLQPARDGLTLQWVRGKWECTQYFDESPLAFHRRILQFVRERAREEATNAKQ